MGRPFGARFLLKNIPLTKLVTLGTNATPDAPGLLAIYAHEPNYAQKTRPTALTRSVLAAQLPTLVHETALPPSLRYSFSTHGHQSAAKGSSTGLTL
jgi:hypothetical protein